MQYADTGHAFVQNGTYASVKAPACALADFNCIKRRVGKERCLQRLRCSIACLGALATVGDQGVT